MYLTLFDLLVIILPRDALGRLFVLFINALDFFFRTLSDTMLHFVFIFMRGDLSVNSLFLIFQGILHLLKICTEVS